MQALLVLVHGSPNAAANSDMFSVVEELRARGVYAIVEVGFMECNEPSIPEAIDLCVAAGATKITAVPYFLHIGTHVCQDLPELMRDGKSRHPEIEFRLADYLGLSETLTDLLAERAG
jgi:sirohydrochlorin ferrochelatase